MGALVVEQLLRLETPQALVGKVVPDRVQRREVGVERVHGHPDLGGESPQRDALDPAVFCQQPIGNPEDALRSDVAARTAYRHGTLPKILG